MRTSTVIPSVQTFKCQKIITVFLTVEISDTDKNVTTIVVTPSSLFECMFTFCKKNGNFQLSYYIVHKPNYDRLSD